MDTPGMISIQTLNTDCGFLFLFNFGQYIIYRLTRFQPTILSEYLRTIKQNNNNLMRIPHYTTSSTIIHTKHTSTNRHNSNVENHFFLNITQILSLDIISYQLALPIYHFWHIYNYVTSLCADILTTLKPTFCFIQILTSVF